MIRALIVAALLAGCVRVHPQQRETLASSALTQPPWPGADGAEQHVYLVREGSSGAMGATGGGCGCN